MAKDNEQRLENLRVNTGRLLKNQFQDYEQEYEDLLDFLFEYQEIAKQVANDFIQLDISLLEGGNIPGAWGSSKLSKSNYTERQPGPSQYGVSHISDT